MTINKILNKYNIKEDTKFHNWSYAYDGIVKAMKEFGKQCYIAGQDNGIDIVVNPLDKNDEIMITFKEYLKNLENDSE